ncbi:MAG TPA: response regulator [Nitrososphaerales archaeon]|nr:response regulator [Nitrososphaerales archaeon]
MTTTVLVADDQADIRRIYAEVLTSKGFAVVSARDGIEAISKFKEQRPDIVVLDNNMPGCTGLEAASEILAIHSSAKVIMVSADEQAHQEANRLGVDLFLTKPVSVKKFIESVEIER